MMWHGGQIAVAHYDLINLQIYVMPDTIEADDFTLVKQGL